MEPSTDDLAKGVNDTSTITSFHTRAFEGGVNMFGKETRIILKGGEKRFLHRYHNYEYLKWRVELGADYIPIDSWLARYRHLLKCKRCKREVVTSEVSYI